MAADAAYRDCSGSSAEPHRASSEFMSRVIAACCADAQPLAQPDPRRKAPVARPKAHYASSQAGLTALASAGWLARTLGAHSRVARRSRGCRLRVDSGRWVTKEAVVRPGSVASVSFPAPLRAGASGQERTFTSGSFRCPEPAGAIPVIGERDP